MRVTWLVPFLLSLAAVASARAQAPSGAPRNLTMVQQMDRFAAGKPIPLVAAAYGSGAKQPRPAADTTGKEWLSALQAIAESVSRELVPASTPFYVSEYYLPWCFGNVWTLEPDQQWNLRLDLAGQDIYAAYDPQNLLPWLLNTLSAEQMRKAAGAGVTWRDWTPEQQRLLAAILRPPVTVTAPGRTAEGIETRKAVPLPSEGLPLRRAAFRLKLGLNWASYPLTAGTGRGIIDMAPDGPRLHFFTRRDASPGTRIRYREAVPAKLKPGDLNFDARLLNAPIGLRGVTTLKEAVAAAAKATGAPLKLSPEFDAMPVFIGDATLRTGDVLKTLTFGMQGAWRKVGGTYLLAWDRIGRGAVSLWQEEAIRPLERAANAARNATERHDADVILWENLPPDPDDPLGPTAEQRDLLTALPARNADGAWERPVLAFSNLTGPQQAAVADRLRTSYGFRGAAPPTAEDLSRVEISEIAVRAMLDVPGIGAVTLDAPARTLHPGSRPEPAPTSAPAPDWPPKDLPTENSLALLQPVRAVAPPMLPRSEWPRLIEQMQRKGLNTLYVPVLWDGQALFPSRHFPQPEALAGHDVLSEILSLAKPANIKVIAVVHALAWRNSGGSAVHWLRKHPDWVDVDILGRPRREWATPERLPATAGDGSDWAEDPALYADYVQPGNPAVRAKLTGFLEELRHYPALDGVALDHWMRTAGRDYAGPAAPSLGFSPAERAAALEKTGRDPVDITTIHLGNRQALEFTPDPWEPAFMDQERDAFDAAAYEADAALAAGMLREIEKTWPGGAQLFNPLRAFGDGQVAVSGGELRPLPKADVVISSAPAPGKPGQYRWLPAPMALMGIPDPNAPAAMENERMARAAVRMRRLAAPPVEGAKLSGVVLDFTTAPDLLWPCLRLLANTSGG